MDNEWEVRVCPNRIYIILGIMRSEVKPVSDTVCLASLSHYAAELKNCQGLCVAVYASSVGSQQRFLPSSVGPAYDALYYVRVCVRARCMATAAG